MSIDAFDSGKNSSNEVPAEEVSVEELILSLQQENPKLHDLVSSSFVFYDSDENVNNVSGNEEAYKRLSSRYIERLHSYEELLSTGGSVRQRLTSLMQRIMYEELNDAIFVDTLVATPRVTLDEGACLINLIVSKHYLRLKRELIRLVKEGQAIGELSAVKSAAQIVNFLFIVMQGIRVLARVKGTQVGTRQMSRVIEMVVDFL